MGEEGAVGVGVEEGRLAPDVNPWWSLEQRQDQLRAQAAEVHVDLLMVADSWVRHGGGLVVVLQITELR